MTLTETKALRLAELFSALSDATRVRIIAALFDRELNVNALAVKLKMSESAVSHQLRGLRQTRIVRARKEGRQVFYCLQDDHVAKLFKTTLEHIEHG